MVEISDTVEYSTYKIVEMRFLGILDKIDVEKWDMRTAVTHCVWKDTLVYFFGKSCRSADIRPDNRYSAG